MWQDRARSFERALPARAHASDRLRLLCEMNRLLRALLEADPARGPVTSVAIIKATNSHHAELEQAQDACNVDYIVFFGVRNKGIFAFLAQGQPTHRCASNSSNFSLHTHIRLVP